MNKTEAKVLEQLLFAGVYTYLPNTRDSKVVDSLVQLTKHNLGGCGEHVGLVVISENHLIHKGVLHAKLVKYTNV